MGTEPGEPRLISRRAKEPEGFCFIDCTNVKASNVTFNVGGLHTTDEQKAHRAMLRELIRMPNAPREGVRE